MPDKPDKTMPAPANGEKQINVRGITEELHTAIRQRAVEQRTTVQVIVLQAFKDAGLPVPDALLIPHRRTRGNE
ncbi:MAG TPA: hypothetical protein VND94_18795 [Terriglobia bacterium]|nr:hypothetical protein [Terriglobia bacterium]